MNLNLSNKKFNIMGILNITPDSFYDGGKYTNLDNVMFRVEQMNLELVIKVIVDVIESNFKLTHGCF